MYRLGLASPTECWTGTFQYDELGSSDVSPPTLDASSHAIVVGSLVVDSNVAISDQITGTVEGLEGEVCTVRWTGVDQVAKVPLRNLTLKPTLNIGRGASPEAQPMPPTPGGTVPKTSEKKKTTLEAAKFGQRFVLGVVVWLDFDENGIIDGTLEISEFQCRIRLKGVRNADEIYLEEMGLEAGRNADWQCRFDQDSFLPGTQYRLRFDVSGEELSCDFSLPPSKLNGTTDPRYQGPAGHLCLQRRRLFHLSCDAHGTSMVVPKERTSVSLSSIGGESSLAGLALSEVGFSRGVHYWEIKVDYADDHGTVFCGVVERPHAPVYPTGVPLPNLNKWEKVPASWGFISFRAALQMTAGSTTGGIEQIYGEFYETGDTVGVLLDLDVGEISFFIDALKFGEHIVRDLGPAFFPHQLGARSTLKWNPTGELQVLYPAVGLKRCSGDTVSVSAKYISFPSSEAESELENIGHLSKILRGHFGGSQQPSNHRMVDSTNTNRAALPEWFLDQGFQHYERWCENRYKTVPSRAGGRLVELDISEEAMAKACTLGGVDPPFAVGEKVSTLQSDGRDLSAPETVVVLGSRLNRVWYTITSVSSHEGFGDGATWAFYWEPEELASVIREDDLEKDKIPNIQHQLKLDRDEFRAQAGQDPRWTNAMDEELVKLINLELQREGNVDFMNLAPGLTIPDTLLCRRAGLREEAVRARIALLRLLNCMVRRALPFLAPTSSSGSSQLSSSNQMISNVTSWLHRARNFIFASTKRTYWDAVLRATTTGTTLSSEEYVDPPQIRVVCVNRVKASPARLAGILSESKRMKRSVFGQLYAEMIKWPDHAFRRAYCGKGHGGQKRAFKLKLIGEGVDDYGGPYRQAFEVVCDELQNDTAWPDDAAHKRSCLLPLLIPSPNRFSQVGDVGRDKFVVNPSARLSTHLRRFEFLGKLIGTAIRHGLQLGLDLPNAFWRQLAGLPVTLAHIAVFDLAFARDLELVESASKDNFVDVVGLERRFQVVLSDGSIVGGEDSRIITADNKEEYVEFALRTRLAENDAQMSALRKGLGAVLPIEHFALFSAEELELLVCGRRELDVALLRSVTEYENGVKDSDAHVKWFWEVLEEMTPEDRTAFLKFAWARSRMPSKAELATAFHLQMPSGGAAEKPDEFLPSAQTCFFSLALPKYSSKDILRTKFLKAIECTLMDADVRLRSGEGWADV